MKKLVNISFLIFCLCFLGFFAHKFLRIEFIKKAQSQQGQPQQNDLKQLSAPTDMPIPPEMGGPPAPPAGSIAEPATGGSPMPPLPQPVNEVPDIKSAGDSGQIKSPQELDPNMKFVSSEGFVYDPVGRRDPFKAFITISSPVSDPNAGATAIVSSGSSSRSTIPSYLARPDGVSDTLIGNDVDAFKLVGILWDVHDPKAMLRSQSGKVFMVRLKSRVGRNNGYVAAIREGEVVVVELMDDAKTPATRILSLQK